MYVWVMSVKALEKGVPQIQLYITLSSTVAACDRFWFHDVCGLSKGLVSNKKCTCIVSWYTMVLCFMEMTQDHVSFTSSWSAAATFQAFVYDEDEV